MLFSGVAAKISYPNRMSPSVRATCDQYSNSVDVPRSPELPPDARILRLSMDTSAMGRNYQPM
jgi:hypothetical protein